MGGKRGCRLDGEGSVLEGWERGGRRGVGVMKGLGELLKRDGRKASHDRTDEEERARY